MCINLNYGFTEVVCVGGSGGLDLSSDLHENLVQMFPEQLCRADPENTAYTTHTPSSPLLSEFQPHDAQTSIRPLVST